MKHFAPHGQPFCSARYWPSRCTDIATDVTCKSCIRAINTDESLSFRLSDAQRARAGRGGKPLPPFFIRPGTALPYRESRQAAKGEVDEQ